MQVIVQYCRHLHVVAKFSILFFVVVVFSYIMPLALVAFGGYTIFV